MTEIDKPMVLADQNTSKELWVAYQMRVAREKAELDWERKQHPNPNPSRRMGRPPKHYPACEQWPWEKTNTAISRQVKVGIQVIRLWRRKLGKPDPTVFEINLPNPSMQKKAVAWNEVDWTLGDAIISRKIGVSRERVRQKRAELGIPRVPYNHLRDNFYKFREWLGDRKHLKYGEHPPGMEIEGFQIRKWCAILNVEVDEYKIIHSEHWGLMNFDLPNCLLEKIWRIKYVASWRSGHAIHKAVFQIRGGVVKEEFRALVAAEQAKADNYWAGQARKQEAPDAKTGTETPDGEENAPTGNVEPPNPSPEAT